MLLTTKEMNDIYIERILNKFLNKDRNVFKIDLNKNILSDNSIIKILNQFTYTYGWTEMFGMYFIVIDKNREGFIWLDPYTKEKENGIFLATKKYKYMENTFYSLYNIETFRNELIEEIRDFEKKEEEPLTVNNFLMRLRFNHRLKISRPIVAKFLCQFFISKTYSNKYSVDKEYLESFKKDIDNKVENDIHRFVFASDRKKINISNQLIYSMEKIIKEEVSIELFLEDINSIYF